MFGYLFDSGITRTPFGSVTVNFSSPRSGIGAVWGGFRFRGSGTEISISAPNAPIAIPLPVTG
ncbi:hypothetical protein RHMOL_Rhmol05G0083000 [Rhododendron molle]|uniref:Uncharacterized protein n=1 Tax=Rhododendron molle TaxID=49168 RepID=A0ACC0NMY6_RHOML|nr:hypothetical protein RHMOL_Rhmol05G0083000 [Rhododendron molle]